MKNIIIYSSPERGNTKKIVDYIMENIKSGSDIKAYDMKKEAEIMNILKDGEVRNVIFASGIFYGKMAPDINSFIEKNAESLKGKKIYSILSAGLESIDYKKEIKRCLDGMDLDTGIMFQCRGYDASGPWKLTEGISVNHPDENDLKNALDYVEKVISL